MDLISKSANRVCFWFVGTICGATPLLLHNISLLYVQTLSNNGATGPHYRFPLQGVLLYQGRYQKSRQINVSYILYRLQCFFFNNCLYCEHLDHVWTLVKCDLLVYLEELGCSIWFWGRERNYSGQESQKCKCIHRHTWCMLPYVCSFPTNHAPPSGCILNIYRNSR